MIKIFKGRQESVYSNYIIKKLCDIFIIRNGAPLYCKKRPESKLKADEILTAGFLSALSSLAREIGAGQPKFYATENSRFFFFEKSGHLFIIHCDVGIPESEVLEFGRKLVKIFFRTVEHMKNPSKLPAFEDPNPADNLKSIGFNELNDELNSAFNSM